MASMPRMICLCISLAAVWAYFTKLAAPEPLIGAFFSGLLGALFLGAKPAESKKVKKQAVKRDDTSVEDNETDEDDEDDEDFKQIGLDIAKENIVPAGSRRTSKVRPSPSQIQVHRDIRGPSCSSRARGSSIVSHGVFGP